MFLKQTGRLLECTGLLSGGGAHACAHTERLGEGDRRVSPRRQRHRIGGEACNGGDLAAPLAALEAAVAEARGAIEARLGRS